MSAPLHIPLSTFNQARFAAFQQEKARIDQRSNDAVTTIIAQDRDPASFAGWSITLNATEIVCTPPAEAEHESPTVPTPAEGAE